MPTLYENYVTGDDTVEGTQGAVWHGQTFTPSVTHTITSVKLLLLRLGSPGTYTVSIRATSAGLPTGSDLCSGTTDGDTLPTASPFEWREITFGAGTLLTASTVYAICVRAPSGNANNQVRWRADGSSPTYADGNLVYSLNIGVDWVTYTAHDAMFEDWGEGQTSYQNTGQGSMAIASTDARIATFYRIIGGASLTSVGAIVKASTFYRTIGGASLAIAGALSRARLFSQAVGGAASAIAGTLVKKTSLTIGQASLSIAGALSTVKVYARAVGGAAMTIASSLSAGLLIAQAVGGAAMTIAGALSTIFHDIVEAVKTRWHFPARSYDGTQADEIEGYGTASDEIEGYGTPQPRYKFPSDYE